MAGKNGGHADVCEKKFQAEKARKQNAQGKTVPGVVKEACASR